MSAPLRVWFITGCSSGFGRCLAEQALGRGERVVATARDISSLHDLQTAFGERVCTVALDVTRPELLRPAIERARSAFGRIDVVVNNAGYGLLGAVEESSAEEVEGVYRTNVFGLLNVVRAVLPSMRARHSGHIMNISSVGGYAGYQGWGIYGSTKFAVEGITEAMYAELKPLGIHATVVEPGFFRTNFLDPSSLIETKARIGDYAETVGQMREFAGGHNGQQPGDPAKLAQALLRLANTEEPPLRLPLGSDTVARIEAKNAFVAEQTERWKDLSLSTDF